MSDLIDDITVDVAHVAPGQSIQIAVQPKGDQQVTIAIDGVRGATQYIQAPTTPGEHTIEVVAGTPEGSLERRVVTITVADDQTPHPLLTLRQDPYQPMAAAIQIAPAEVPAGPDGAPAIAFEEGSAFRWTVGDVTIDSAAPVLLHDFAQHVDHTQQFTNVDVSLSAVAPDGREQVVRRTVAVWSSYQIAKASGFIQPPAHGDGIALPRSAAHYEATFTVQNVEDEAVTYTGRQIQWMTSDLDAVVSPGPVEAFALSLGGHESALVDLEVDRTGAPGSADGFTVHLHGSLADGTPVHSEASFEFGRRPVRDKIPKLEGLFVKPDRLDGLINIVTGQDDGPRPEWLDQVKGGAAAGLDERQLWSLRTASAAMAGRATLQADGGQIGGQDAAGALLLRPLNTSLIGGIAHGLKPEGGIGPLFGNIRGPGGQVLIKQNLEGENLRGRFQPHVRLDADAVGGIENLHLQHRPAPADAAAEGPADDGLLLQVPAQLPEARRFRLSPDLAAEVVESITRHHLDDGSLIALGKKVAPGRKPIDAWGSDFVSIDRDGIVALLAGSPAEGSPCDPDDLPDPVPDGWACQFTGDYENRWLPGRIRNAYKGDVILSPGGNGLIGGLLKQVTPPQRYSHTMIMTKNYYELSHATGADEWLNDHANGVTPPGEDKKVPSDGFEPAALKYLWPGGITQTAEEALGGSMFTSPEGKEYQLHAFSREDSAKYGDRWELIPAMVIKPHPTQDSDEARHKLHQVADLSRSWCVTGPDTKGGKQSRLHYRFYCYSDAGIALRTDPATGTPEGTAPSDAGWATGTVPAVCSLMVLMAARGKGFHLEGPADPVKAADLEPSDVDAAHQAQVDDKTLDGLYLYTAQERHDAALWLHSYMTDKVLREAKAGGDILGWAFDTLTDISSDVANQLVNVFASDWADTEAKDSERWKDVTEGRAVSPDDLMMYDSPQQGGLWGYVVPMDYRAGRFEQVPKTVWKQTTGPGTLTGLVRHGGAPAPDTLLTVNGHRSATGGDGRFSMQLEEGRYTVDASKQVGYAVAEKKADVTVKFRETTDVVIDLDDPPEVYRQLIIDGFHDGNDDEDWGDDEQFHDGVHQGPFDLGPFGTHAEFGISRKWGGEVRAEYGFKADWQHDNAITIHVDGKLFEGTSENTDDLDGTCTLDWRIPAGETQVLEAFVRDDDEDENTWSRLTLHVTNRRAG